jgi:exosortase
LSATSSLYQKKWTYFGVWVLLCILLYFRPITHLVQLAWSDDTASHILLIPFISAWLLYTERKPDSPNKGLSFGPAVAFFLPSVIALTLAVSCASCSAKNILFLYMVSLILLVISGFILFLGVSRAKSSSFALAFLLFTVPIPDPLLNKIIYWLQAGSAAIAEVLFNLSGAPVLREGFVFHLPKMSIEVAQECSGIRSSLALLILALLVAHFSFSAFWKKAVFICAGLAMMLVKNGIRIATLTLLANYVNPEFLYGRLHHQGGVVFFLIGLALLLPVFWYLRRGEVDSVAKAKQVAPEQAPAAS